MILYLDIETFSEVPINNGTHVYAENAEVMIVSYAIDDGPVQVFDRTDFGKRIPASGAILPNEIERALADPNCIVVIHNSMFDRTVLRHNFAPIDPKRIHDTMVQAMSHGLPGGLAKLCQIFKMPEEIAKHQGGKELIQLFCKPTPKNQKVRRRTGQTDPDKWQQLLDYAGGDIHAMRYLYKTMPRWNYPAREHPLWVLDQKINDRGFKVDLDLAASAIETVKLVAAEKNAETVEQTEGRMKSTRQRDALLKELLYEHGVTLPDLTGNTIERRLEDETLPEPVKELLRNRLMVSSTSTAKYNKILKGASKDGRLRGGLQFSGAMRTKRWSGRLFQPQNLPRPDMDADEIEFAIRAFKSRGAHVILDDPMRAAWNALRGLIVADEGRKLVQADLAQIEARMLPWLAGEQWKLDAFQQYDLGLGPDLYYVGAARLLRIDPEEVTKPQRQSHGKVPDLACLGPHTRVLTNNGIKFITEVTVTDKLWDGREWISHQGVVMKGQRETLLLDGLEITDDHLVLHENAWLSAKTVASDPNILHTALATGTANLLSSAKSGGRKAGLRKSGFNVLVEPTPIASTRIIYVLEKLRAAWPALVKRSARRASNGGNMKPSSLIPSIAADFAAECRLVLIAAITPKTRRSTTTAVEASKSSLRGAKIEADFSPIWSHWKAGISRCWNWIASTTLWATNPAIFASSPSSATQKTGAPSGNSKRASNNLRPVFDIAHAGPRNRFTVLTDNGCLIVHNCGYGGADGAFAQFAALYRVDMDPWEVHEAIRLWREAHPAIADWDNGLWAKLDRAAREAIRVPGRIVAAGDYIHFEKWRNWLKMHLPSGGFLSYASPQIIADPRRPGSDTVSYMGVNNYTKKWERITTYGGKLSADATQSTARELLAANMQRIEDAGYPIILLVHDEVVTEPVDSPAYTVQSLVELLTHRPSWIDDKLPLNAGGFEAYRYRKDD